MKSLEDFQIPWRDWPWRANGQQPRRKSVKKEGWPLKLADQSLDKAKEQQAPENTLEQEGHSGLSQDSS